MRLNTETKVGIVVLLAIVALSYMTFKIGGLRFGEEGYRLFVVFPDVAGLNPMAPVQIAGVDVGKVEQIELVEGGAQVTLRMDAGIKVKKGSSALILSSGLLGDRFVGLHLGTGKTVLKDGDRLLAASAGAGMDQLTDQASRLIRQFSEVAENIRVITASLKEVLATKEGKQSMQDILMHVKSLTQGVDLFISENRTAMGRSITNLQDFSLLLKKEGERLLTGLTRITQKIESGEGTLGKLVYDEAVYDKLRATLESFNGSLEGISSIIEQVKRGEGTLGKLVYDQTVYDKLESTLNALSQSLKSIETVVKKIESGEGTIGKLVSEDSAYQNLNSALEKVSNTLGRIDRFNVQVNVRDEYQLEGNRNKGYVSLKLYPHPDKYYLLEIVDDPLGEVSKTSNLTTTNGVPVTQTDLTTKRKLKISALLGKRFPELGFGFRAGLMESAFGMGADLYLAKNRSRFSLDAWDFNSDDPLSKSPHLKFSAEYDPWHNVYFIAGLDQILNAERETPFVGGGLRFEDDDLKYLLGSLAISR